MDKPRIILGSKSPRRQTLIKELGFDFEIRTKEVEEIYPEDLNIRVVPEYLAKLKASTLEKNIDDNEILLTSDTVVILNNQLLGKPESRAESIQMLKSLSGNMHEVITGVYLCSTSIQKTFSSITKVYFSGLTDEEIEHYVDSFEPFDKAGSYGIQEWIGYIGISKIEGCYYNVMGLPLHDIYKALKTDFSF